MLYLSIKAAELTEWLGFPITNTFLATILTTLVFIILVIVISKKISIVPKGFYNAVEALFEGILNFMDGVTDSRKKTLKYVPIVVTLFLFLFVANLLSLLPIFGPITVDTMIDGQMQTVPLLRNAIADYSIPFIFAFVGVIVLQVYIIAKGGLLYYMRRFLPWYPPPDDAETVMDYAKWFGMTLFDTMLGLINIISEIAKIVSLSFRLFGSVLSSEILFALLMFFISYVAPTMVLGLSLFFGSIQAMVFSFLILVFFNMEEKEIIMMKEQMKEKLAKRDAKRAAKKAAKQPAIAK
ncbi:FoF1 ATP synthase subunit a [Patescibacteria group bacterium]